MADSTFTIQQNTVNGLVSTLDGKASVDLSNSPYTTNRILEIPQDIKLELNNGTLTLKAGSKVYVPNGSGVFDVATVESDLNYTTWGTSVTEKALMIYNKASNVFVPYPLRSATSGESAPTDSGLFYDTSNNKVRYYSSGSLLTDNLSLPFAVVDFQNSAATSIDQVFNGFGYIGSTVFALPGVKVQMPAGINEDGTYKSVLYTQQSVSILTVLWGNLTGKYPLFLRQSPNGLDGSAYNYYFVSSTTQLPSTNCLFYDSKTNLTGGTDSGSIYYFMNVYVGTMTLEAGVLKGVNVETVDSVLNSSLSNLSAAGQAKFDAKANAANTVTTDTNQTISGSKRFTQPAEGMSIELTADTNQQTVPATATFRQLGLYRNSTYTKGDGYTSWIQGVRGSDGWTATELYARRFLESDSQEIVNYLRVNITPDGVPVSYTRTPPVAVASDEIVTAGWINSKMQVVSALPAEPDPNVFYFIPE